MSAQRCVVHSWLYIKDCSAIQYNRFAEWARPNRKMVLFIVFSALLLDNMLLTVIVPIIPDYLYGLEHPGYKAKSSAAAKLAANTTNATSPSSVSSTQAYELLPEDILSENSKIGWLFASKAIIQLIMQPFIGKFVNRVGYTFPLFLGIICLFISSIIFAFAGNYGWLLIARSLQGLGSAFSATSGLGLVADKYPNDIDRSRAMGIVLSGIAAGVLVGYPCGSLLYDFWDTAAPFLLTTFFLLLLGVLVHIVLQPTMHNKIEMEGTELLVLLRDKYIVICALAVCVTTTAMAMLEPTLPLWLMDTMHPPKWQIGLVFLPDSFGYLLGTNLFGVVSLKLGRWICAMSAMLLVGSCLIMLPFANQIEHLVIPHFGVGLGIGIVDSSIMPMLAHLVDTRYNPVYGTVYAIEQIAVSLAYGIGPAIGGQVIKTVGFPWLMRSISIVIMIYSPMCIYLRAPPGKEEDMAILPGDKQNPPFYMSDLSKSDTAPAVRNEQPFTYQRFQEEYVQPRTVASAPDNLPSTDSLDIDLQGNRNNINARPMVNGEPYVN